MSREREAFEALLSLVVEDARVVGALNSEHRIWAMYGEWRAGGRSAANAREALKDVIRTALTEQTGGER
jgi:hypothetical protein